MRSILTGLVLAALTGLAGCHTCDVCDDCGDGPCGVPNCSHCAAMAQKSSNGTEHYAGKQAGAVPQMAQQHGRVTR